MSPALFNARKSNVTAFYFCKFFERASRDQPRKPRGRGEGSEEVFTPCVGVSFLGAKNIPLTPEEGKGEVFTLGLTYPWQSADKDETDSRSGRRPTPEGEAKNVEAGHRQFPHLKSKSSYCSGRFR